MGEEGEERIEEQSSKLPLFSPGAQELRWHWLCSEQPSRVQLAQADDEFWAPDPAPSVRTVGHFLTHFIAAEACQGMLTQAVYQAEEVCISPLGAKLQAVLFSTCPAPRTCVHNLEGRPQHQRLGCAQEEQHRASYGSTPQSNTQHREAPLGSCKGQEWGLEPALSPTHLGQPSL